MTIINKEKEIALGVKGVCWNKRYCKWQARIYINNIGYFLGYFDDILEASKAYENANIALHGEFSNLG